MAFRYYIDRENDNSFTVEDEITADVMSAEWRIGLRNSQIRMADENVARLVVNNTSGKYAPENTASPLFGQLTPRRRLRITEGDMPLWTGWLSVPQVVYRPMGDASGQSTAILEGVGGKQLLEQLPARLPYYTAVTADVILTDIFSEELLPPAIADVWRLGDNAMSFLGITSWLGSIANFAHLDEGQFVFEVFGDTAHDDLWAVIHHLVTAERGYFFFNREGRAVFWNRHRIHSPNMPIATITSENAHAPMQVGYRYGANMANEVLVESQPRRMSEDETILWELDNPIQLAPYASLTIEARLRRESGQYVSANAGLVASATFERGSASISITSLGSKALIHLQNNTNRTTILENLSLQGASSARQNALAVMKRDEDSLGQYGRFGMTLKLGAPANAMEIRHIAEYEVLERAQPKGVIDKLNYIESATQPNPQRLMWTLGSALHIQLQELGHEAEYIIIGEQHKIENAVHQSEYVLLQKPRPFWVLDEMEYATLGINTWVGY